MKYWKDEAEPVKVVCHPLGNAVQGARNSSTA